MLASLRDRMRPTRRGRTSSLVLLAALGLLLSACGNAPQSALDPQGPFAEKPDDLYKIVVAIAAVVFVVVQGLIIYVVVKFREKPEDADGPLPVQVHGNTFLEVAWTALPALVLAAIAVPTISMIFDLRETESEAYEIEVIGHRWWFEYRYEDGTFATANELVIPVGEQVRLKMTAEEAGSVSNAVIHSFWIPALAGKRDLVPGRTAYLNLQADEPGRYLGQCAEYCGLSHANMRARAIALPRAEFDAWLEAQKQDAAEPTDALALQGKELFMNNSCVGCHAISGTAAQGNVGPNLTHLMSRKEYAGAVLDLYLRDADGNFTDTPNTELLTQWVRCAPDLKAMRPDFKSTGMPCFTDSLSQAEAEAIVAYLITLK